MKLLKHLVYNQKFQFLTGVVAIVGTLIILRSPGVFFVELLYSLAPQLMLASLLAGIVLILYRAWWPAISMFICGALFFIHLMPFLSGGDNTVKGTHDIQVAHFNVHIRNSNFDSILCSAQNSGADLLSFQEVSQSWGARLYQDLSDKYPYHLVVDTLGTQGIAIFSRHPVEGMEVIWLEGLPNITGTVKAPKADFRFVAFHTKTPVTPEGFSKRNAHLKAVSEYVRSYDEAMLVLGDFNIVPWSKYLRQFSRDSGLIESRQSFAATFPAGYGPLMIPIDYIFHSPHLVCQDFYTISDTSSDHYGILGKYSFRHKKFSGVKQFH